MSIHTINGQLVMTQQLNLLDSETIDVKDLPNQTLIIQFYNELGQLIQTDKIIKL